MSIKFHHLESVFQFHHTYSTFSLAVISWLWQCDCRARQESHSTLLLMLPLALMRALFPFNEPLETFHHFSAVTEGLVGDRKLKGSMLACQSVSEHLDAANSLLHPEDVKLSFTLCSKRTILMNLMYFDGQKSHRQKGCI